MKKIELLAPAGDMEALVAAIEAGADAIYMAGKSFGARAFAKNFTNEEIVEAINYAHLYGVKVYITINTLIYDREVAEFLKYIEFIHKNNVDAVLIQDLGMLDLVRKTFPNLEIHASTQMHIHNLDGVLMAQKLGIKRVVLARETPFYEIEKIKRESQAEIEVFVHGALCISYSGECLMSSLIGGRSGNRGACTGACRLKYDIVDDDNNKLNKEEYPLSTKDLNSLEYLDRLINIGIDSLKIEGRMKSKEYVYKVVSLYRKAIDNYYKYGKIIIDNQDIKELKKIFNREYTKGFLNGANNDEVINGYRPNHMGYPCGVVTSYNNGYANIRLEEDITIGSGLRVIGKEDVGINVNEFYIGDKLVKEAHKGATIKIKVNSPVKVNDKVVITLDSKLNKRIDEEIGLRKRKVLIEANFEAKIGKAIKLELSDGMNKVLVTGVIADKAKSKAISKEDVSDKLKRINDTVYEYKKLDINIQDNVFVPISSINKLRQEAILELNKKRLYKIKFIKKEYKIDVPNFKQEKIVTCLVDSKDKYSKFKDKYDMVYATERIDGAIYKYPKVVTDYRDNNDIVMISEMGGLYKHHKGYTDYSLNVVNSYTVALLHSLGVKRVTLSYELNDSDIKELIDNYHKRYKKHPNLELIVSGYIEAMTSKYRINETYKRDNLYLRDRFGNKFKIKDKDGLMYIYFYKKRDIYNEKYYDMGINSLRFNLEA